jgi:hypothetical protein
MPDRRFNNTNKHTPTAAPPEATATLAAPSPITADSPLPDRLAELERQIGAALSSEQSASALQSLFFQLERALPAATEFARLENERSLDPTQAPDPVQARQAAENATFAANRLASLKPRLSVICTKQIEKEAAAAYLKVYAEFRPKRDALEQEFTDQYQALCDKLLELFARVRDFQNRVHATLSNPPPGVPVLKPIDAAQLLDKVQLLALDTGKVLWPSPQTPLGVVLAEGMKFSFDPRFSSEWGNPKLREQRAAEAKLDSERTAARYKRMEIDQTQRVNEEERQRFARAHGLAVK